MVKLVKDRPVTQSDDSCDEELREIVTCMLKCFTKGDRPLPKE